MREIKFRAWDDETKLMEYTPHIGLDEFFNDDGVLIPPERCEVMQFTGLHDKNGKEIYEGDIVDCTLSANDGIFSGKYRGTVMFEEFEYGIETTDGSWPFASWSCVMSCEVISNIYENPELLEGYYND